MGSTEEIRGVVMIDLNSYTKGGDKDGAKTEDYQTQMEKFGWRGPHMAAEAFMKFRDTSKDIGSTYWLNAGCGDGIESAHFKPLGVKKAVGLDYTADMLDMAAKLGFYEKTIQHDLNSPLSFVADSTFDLVTCLGVLTYIKPESGVLTEFCRVTKPGGLIIMTHRIDVYDVHNWKAPIAECVTSGLVEELSGPVVVKTAPTGYLPLHPQYKDILSHFIVWRRTDKAIKTNGE
mmetsp:Transcript_20433/g.49698  ORF Transcript_20433/g.49698 Transcript_20433/m.49698 type:complete len:232 (-) Transcript_20433:500-1195(-)